MICTSRVKIPKKELVNGMNVYRVEVVRLRDRNADKVFEKLRRKINRGKILRRHDVFPPLLSPPPHDVGKDGNEPADLPGHGDSPVWNLMQGMSTEKGCSQCCMRWR